MILTKLLVIDAFREYLTKGKPSDIAGKRRSVNCCPIGEYLATETGFNWFVSNIEVYCTDASPSCPIEEVPNWAFDFIADVDESEECYLTKSENITYAECLMILDSILEPLKRQNNETNEITENQGSP